LSLQDVTSLGKYAKRKFQMPVTQKDDADEDDDFPATNKYAEDEPELARVVDVYSAGDLCDATGKPRQTKVKYNCCSDRLMERYKGPVLRNGNPVTSKIVSIVNLFEDPDEVCTYTITVCTPLLCEEIKSDEDDGLLFNVAADSMLKSSSSKSKPMSRKTKHSASKPRKENESVRDILDRTIGEACIQSSTSGWYVRFFWSWLALWCFTNLFSI
jgi:hypothetical protein